MDRLSIHSHPVNLDSYPQGDNRQAPKLHTGQSHLSSMLTIESERGRGDDRLVVRLRSERPASPG